MAAPEQRHSAGSPPARCELARSPQQLYRPHSTAWPLVCPEGCDARDVEHQEDPSGSCPPSPKALPRGLAASASTEPCPGCSASEGLLTLQESRQSSGVPIPAEEAACHLGSAVLAGERHSRPGERSFRDNAARVQVLRAEPPRR